MGRYILRSVKYLLGLVALVAALYCIMYVLHLLPVTPLEALRGQWRLLAALVVLAAAYPRFGFVRRTVEGSLARDKDTVVRVFGEAGFRLAGDEEGRLEFRALSMLKQTMCLGEDCITVTDGGDGVLTIEGIRRETVGIEFRLRTRLSHGRE